MLHPAAAILRRPRKKWRRRLLAVGSLAGLLLMLLLGLALAWFEQQPRSAVHFAAAEEAREAGRLHEAIAAYEAAVAGDPLHFEARWRLGQTLLALGQPEPALETLEAALPYAALRPALHEDLARARLALGQARRVVAELEAIRYRSPALELLLLEARRAMLAAEASPAP